MGALFDEVRQRITAEDAAREYGLLSGSRRFALCPWHEEKTPSLHFSAKTGRCFCYGCHAGGSAVDLTAKLFGLSPLDAARKLNNDFHLGIDAKGHAPPAGESRLEKRKRFEEFLRTENAKACDVLREVSAKIETVSPLGDEVWTLLKKKEDTLGTLEWLDHLTFDEWEAG